MHGASDGARSTPASSRHRAAAQIARHSHGRAHGRVESALGHLSGIATLTRRWVDAVAGTGAADPRHPQDDAGPARAREVRGALRRRGQPPDVAVGRRAGQGQPRRCRRRRCRRVRAVRTRFPQLDLEVEVECDTVAQAREVVEAGADLVLLDNMTPPELREVVAYAAGRRAARGVRRPAGWRMREAGRRDRRRLPRGRRAHPLGAGARHRGSTSSQESGYPLLLAIDIGNTNTVLGVFDGRRAGAVVAHQDRRPKHRGRAGADFRGLLADYEITGVAACSTVPAALRELRVMLAAYYPNVPTVLVEPGVRTGVGLQYDNPKEVGADRIVNTLAAHHLVHGGPRSSSTSARPRTSTSSASAATSSAVRSRPASRSRSTRSPRAPRSCARSSSSSRAARSARAPSRRCSRESSTASPARSTGWCAG